MKNFYPPGKIKFMVITAIIVVLNFACSAQKIFTPASNNNIAGGNTYCQNVTAGALTYTYNTCNTGTGSSTGTFITIKWYKNGTNSTSGGTVVSTTLVHCALTATGATTYQPSTAVAGTLYYYCTITWTDAGTCNASGTVTSTTATVTVNATPDVITGSTAGCAGTASTLYNSVSGGTWSSSSPSTATISASTGVVSSVAVGNTTITYAIGTCRSTTSFSVISTPAAITGTNTICENAATTFSTTTTGGTWVSGNSAIATTDASSPVNITGLTAGSTTISYVLSPTCYSTRALTVNTAPASITGASSACVGFATTLSNTVSGGTWTSSNTAKATIGSGTGVVSPIAAGTSTISYTIGSCRSTLTFTINSNPGAVTGTNTICQGIVTTFTDGTAGGAWTTGNPAVATVNSSSPVGITGIGAGNTTISYTLPTGCFATRPITVNIAPNAIAGATSACLGSTVSLTNSVAGGIWSSSATSKATINSSGLVTTVANGTTVISYTIGSCATSITFTTLIQPPAIGGLTTNQCQGTTRTYTNTAVGGTWSSNNTSIASINSSTGILTGIGAGTTTITYSTGCGSPVTKSVTIVNNPSAISGATNMCTGIANTLSDTEPSGVWASSNATVATINSSTGLVSPLTSGSTVISYTTGGVCSVTSNVTVNTQPSPISGIAHICAPAAITLTNALAGGTWTSSNNLIATTDAVTGVVTGIATGSAIISYTSNACIATATIGVSTIPSAAITAATNPCINTSTSINFTGTSGAVITYNVDGGGNLTQTLSAGTYLLNTGIISATHVYNLVSVNDAFCNSTINTSATISPIPMQWVGGTTGHETEWNQANNWSCGTVPDSTNDVTLPNGINIIPVIPTGFISTIKSLSIENAAALILSTGSRLTIKNSLANNNYITGNGILKMAGSAAQTISGMGTVGNIEIANASGVSVGAASKMTVKGALTISAGTLNTNDSLTLASDSNGTARISTIPSGSTITGKVKIQQYIQGGYRRYRFLSHPFNSSISLSQIQRSIDITGIGGSSNGFTTTGSNAASAYRLDPYTSNSTLGYDPGWKPFTKINSLAADTNKFKRYQGIRMFMRGSKGEGLGYAFLYDPSAAKIEITGTVNQGIQYVTLARGVDYTQDYNMVGNPYPSPVDIGTVLYNAKVAGKIIGSAFYVWDPTIGSGGQYLAIPIGTSAPIPYSIQALTSFQVRAAFDSAQITFNENNKTQGGDNTLLKLSDAGISLKIYDTNYHLYDMLQIEHNAAATDDEDNNYDAVKPSGTDFAFYSLSKGGRKLAIDARPFDGTKTIPLGITSAYAQEYIIAAEHVGNTGDAPVYLHDKLLNKYILLQQGSEYRFAVTKDKATQGNERFELSAKTGSTVVRNNLEVNLTPNPATDEVNISYKNGTEPVAVNLIDMSGVNVYSTVNQTLNGSVHIPLNDLAAGIYLVEVISGSTKTTHRLVKE